MSAVNAFISRTIKWFLIMFGLATCGTLAFAIDIALIKPMFRDAVDYTPSSVPLLRRWRMMVLGIGALTVVAAFRTWLRCVTMKFSTIEKAFMVYLFLSNLGHPWVTGYFVMFLLDATIVAYSVLYFISDEGRPQQWVATNRAALTSGVSALRRN